MAQVQKSVLFIGGFVAKSGRVGRCRQRWARRNRAMMRRASVKVPANPIGGTSSSIIPLMPQREIPAAYEPGHPVITIRIWHENQRVPATVYAAARPEQKFVIKVDKEQRASRGDEMRYHFGG